jgi:cell fate regulator YaaT (PSP1 superfamily)
MLVVQIRLSASAKAGHFNANGIDFDVGERVVVESDKGLELGDVIRATYDSLEYDNPLFNRIKRVVRRANSEDESQHHRKVSLENEAYDYCVAKIKERGLEMDLVKCDPTLDGRKATFYFTAEGRIDFRDLVKDLAQRFRLRIEMRQIGARDAARVRGGFGHCGRPLCCATWLKEFAPVSIKMAKAQGLSMNPTKISGMCGRLMCCLRYEVTDAAGNAKKGGCSGGGCGSGSGESDGGGGGGGCGTGGGEAPHEEPPPQAMA